MEAHTMEGALRRRILVGLLVLLALLGVVYFFVANKLLDRVPSASRDPFLVSKLVREVVFASPVYSLSGSVMRVVSEEVTLDVPQVLGARIPHDSDLRVRRVRVGPSTKIFARAQKSEAEFEREMRAYEAKGTGPPPTLFSYEQVRLDAIKVGDTLTVRGEPGVDIGALSTVDAYEIIKTNS